MIEFWGIVAIVWLLLLSVLLKPLLQRQAQPLARLGSLKSRSLIGALLASFVVATSALLYVYWSNGYALLVTSSDQESNMVELTEQLAERLAQSPQDNPEGWLLLANSYAALAQYDKAVAAYAQADYYTELEPWAQIGYAEALLIAEGALNDKAMALLELAVAHSRDHQKGLFLIGLAYLERANYAQTIFYWEHLLTLLEADDALTEVVTQKLVEVKELNKDGNVPLPNIPTEAATSVSPQEVKSLDEDCFIRVEVRAATELSAKIEPTDTLFVYAKAVSGPPMPLAIKQFKAEALPLQTCLGSADAMIAGMTIEHFDSISIIARISKSAAATPRAGDLQATSEPLAVVAGSTVSLMINEILE